MISAMTKIDRRAMIAASGAALLLPRSALAQRRGEAFSWNMVIRREQRLTRATFAVTPFLPGADKISYDAFHPARSPPQPRTAERTRGKTFCGTYSTSGSPEL